MTDRHDPYEALRVPDYRRLLAGNVLRSIGTEMQSVAVGWELYQRTDDPLMLGLVGLVQFVPVFLLALPAGQAADRYSRKGLLLVATAMTGAASAGLAVLSFAHGPVPLVYACLLLVGMGQALTMPARWAILPLLVPEGALANAITWNASGWQVASMTGPALGGLVIWLTGGAASAYVLAACCAAAVFLLYASLHPRPAQRSTEPMSLASLLAGVRFVFNTRLVLATITLDLFAVLLGGATALLPIYARDILHVGPAGLGWLRAAPSIGAFVMALGMAHRPPLQNAGRTLLAAVAGFGLATIVFGVSRNPSLSFAMLALTGALDNISVVVRGTLVQVLTPDAMRGRVSAVNSIFIVSSNELGAFESGTVARLVGAVLSVVLGGVGTLLVVIWVAVAWPEVLRLGRLEKPAEPEPEPVPMTEEPAV